MNGVYRSSENNEILKSSGPHRELITDKSFINGNTLKIEINNFITVDNLIEIGENYHQQISINIGGQSSSEIPES